MVQIPVCMAIFQKCSLYKCSLKLSSSCAVDTHRLFVVVVFFLAFLYVLYVSHKLNLLMLSSRLS